MKWQQKVFSKTERAYYAQKENCKTDLDKRYYQMIKESTDESGLIFTYIDDDKFKPADNFGPSELKVSKLRKNVETKPMIDEEKASKIFVDSTQKVVSSRYSTGDDFLKMFIMADLEPTTLLVSIFYRQSDGVLIVYPDFNSLANEYLLEIDQNSKQSFGYCVENISATSSESSKKLAQKGELDKIQEETGELMRKLNIYKDPDFEYPKFLRIVLLLEIIDGRGFEFDNNHVRFDIILPKFVKLVDGNLNGATHSSLKNGDLWNFGFCHSLVLDVDDEFLLSATKLDSIIINLEVISIDPLWERERREGIASLKFPIDGKSKQQIINVSCLRDLQSGSWFQDFLQRFFLGGIHKTQLTDRNQNEVLNLYGNKTVSTGSLKLKIQKVTQMKMSRRNFLQLKSIESIINSYRKAKARLES